MAFLQAWAIAAAATGRMEAPAEHCQSVRARYEIHADGDALWVVGSRHRLSVVVDALDKELQARGWEDTVARGDFTICARRPAEARALTVRDVVVVRAYRNIIFARRRD